MDIIGDKKNTGLRIWIRPDPDIFFYRIRNRFLFFWGGRWYYTYALLKISTPERSDSDPFFHKYIQIIIQSKFLVLATENLKEIYFKKNLAEWIKIKRTNQN